MKIFTYLNNRLIICFLSIFLLANNVESQTIYVSTKGNDKNAGTKERPVASLFRAQELVQHIKSKGKGNEHIKVIIGNGHYEVDQTLLFNEKDGGKQGNPVIWTGEEQGKVFISGGKQIASKLFSTTKDANIVKRLSNEAINHVVEVNLTQLGITNWGQNQQYGFSKAVMPAVLELICNAEPMHLAKYPNNGYIKIGKVKDGGSVPRNGDKANRGATFEYTDARHKSWAGQKDVWFQGTFNYGYADDFIEVERIDTISKLVKLKQPHVYGVNYGKDFRQYKAMNILEELDEPGEWYLDRTTGIVYFWPPVPLEKATIAVSLLEDPIVSLVGVNYLEIQNVCIENGRGIGLYMERGAYNKIQGCTIRNVGNCGIMMGQGSIALRNDMSIDDYEGTPISGRVGSVIQQMYKNTVWDRKAGHDNLINSCDIYNTGSGGIFLGGGIKKTLTPGNNVVNNCTIHDYNRRNKFTWSAINVDGCGNKITHCEIYNSDWQGIYVHGNEHLFEFNNIHDVTLNSDDTSPWYLGRNPSDRGNVVRYNYFHDCGSSNRMNMGVYCDDSATDVFVFGNVFSNMRTNHGVLFSNGGWDHKMQNNIVINPIAETAVVSALYYTWAANLAKSFFDTNGLIYNRLMKDVQILEPPYSTKYPQLANYLNPIVEGKEWEGMRSRRNILSKNIIVGGPDNPIKLLGGIYATITGEDNFVTKEDPGFVDMAKGNFELKQDAVAFKKIPNFQPVPFNKMGIYADAFRKLSKK